MIIIIDNYDSFTYNLEQYVGELGYIIQIFRNNKTSIKEIEQLNPTHIIISPGPGHPYEAGMSIEIISHFSSKIPILGVCLGHQSIGYLFGGYIKKLNQPVHGKTSKIYHNKSTLFSNLPNPFQAVRYHSLIIDEKKLPSTLQITAKTQNGIIMACQHIEYTHIQGIQFHPESLWTENGQIIINNFLSNQFT